MMISIVMYRPVEPITKSFHTKIKSATWPDIIPSRTSFLLAKCLFWSHLTWWVLTLSLK